MAEEDASTELVSKSSWSQGDPAELVWKDVTYDVKDRRILHNLNGRVCGNMLAIMGASGAGKTTLLNLLASRARGGKVGGTVWINGEIVTKHLVKKVAGYVMQDDLFFSHLTVRETLEFAAMMRLPPETPKSEKLQRVNTILDQLGLRSSENDTVGGQGKLGISGGQRKRLSIGVELLCDPRLIFLDEPTSGLDSATAVSIITMVRGITSTCTVVCTIHQPSSKIFEMFDQLLLLTHGKSIFFGPAKEGVNYYASQGFPCPMLANPADHFLDVISADPVDEELMKEAEQNQDKLVSSYEEQDKHNLHLYEPSVSPPDSDEAYHSKLNMVFQFYHLLVRCSTNTYRNYGAIIIAILQNVISAVAIGLVFLQLPLDQTGIPRRFSSLFFISVNQGVYAAYAVLTSFPMERSIVLRERRSGTFQTLPYYLAKCTAELPLQILYPLIFANIVYWLIGYQTTFYKYAHFVLICELGSLTAISVGFFLSAASPTISLAMVCTPLIMEVFRLFGAFFSTPVKLPGWLIWIQALSFITYMYTGMSRNELFGLKFYCKPEQLIGGVCPITTGKLAVEKRNLWELDPYQCELILIAMIIVYRIMAYIAVRKNKNG